MNRNAMQQLLDWKDNPKRKPLILYGARQVGKTWLMKEFGRQYFKSVVYINCDNNRNMQILFEGDYNVDRLLRGFYLETGVEINPNETLIILDEIQEIPKALTSLKYFCEDERHNYFIIAAGSLLGITVHPGVSFPVGKVESLNIYPLSFSEFLEATGNKRYVDLIQQQDYEMLEIFKDKLIESLKTYYYVGGMPECVMKYIENGNFSDVRKIQDQIIKDYKGDFFKHNPSLGDRITYVWDSLISQLAKENKKFIYGVVRPGARAREFEMAVEWLVNAGLVIKVDRIKKGALPLNSYRDLSSFKLYVLDIGLLGAMGGLSAKTIINGNEIFSEFKGSLTENYVAQEIVAELKLQPYYWSAENSTGEIDFIIQNEDNVIPIEVKAGENLKAKSLKIFIEKNNLPYGVRTSMTSFRKEDKLINLPLYAFFSLITHVLNKSSE